MAQFCEKNVKKGTRLFVVATPKNYKPQDAEHSTVLFTITYLNIEGGRRGDKKTEPQAAQVTEQVAAIESENEMPQELHVDAEAIEAIQEEINDYYYFEEEDYFDL